MFASKRKTELSLTEDEASAIIHAAYRQFFEAVPSTDIPCIVLRNAVFRLPRGEHSLKSVELYEEFLVGALLGAKTILEKNRNLPGNTLPNLKP